MAQLDFNAALQPPARDVKDFTDYIPRLDAVPITVETAALWLGVHNPHTGALLDTALSVVEFLEAAARAMHAQQEDLLHEEVSRVEDEIAESLHTLGTGDGSASTLPKDYIQHLQQAKPEAFQQEFPPLMVGHGDVTGIAELATAAVRARIALERALVEHGYKESFLSLNNLSISKSETLLRVLRRVRRVFILGLDEDIDAVKHQLSLARLRKLEDSK